MAERSSVILIAEYLDKLFAKPLKGCTVPTPPLEVIQRQLAAYNAKDIEGFLATYAVDAEQYTLHGERLAKGHAEMRPRYLARFAEPDLNARLISRTVMGNVVVDLDLKACKPS